MLNSVPEKPYYPIGDYFKKKFGEKVYKVSVSVAETCPNRMGLKGMETCVFCDDWGSAAYPEIRDNMLNEQIQTTVDKIRNKYHANKFLVYFQSYTNTFLSVKKLESYYKTALENPNVVGIVVGTRPDCISDGLLKVWKDLSAHTYLSVELGVQSFNNRFLEFMKRGHDSVCSMNAIHRIYDSVGADIGLHYILGNPGETSFDMIELADISNQLPIHNVKLHNLHVLKNTTLERYYNLGQFRPMELDAYTDQVITFLENLSPKIAIQRVNSVSSRWDELIAPEWTKFKMKITQHIIDQMKVRQTYQGKLTPIARCTRASTPDMVPSYGNTNTIEI